MEKIELEQDFREFLSLLNSHQVRYLLVGGYAVGLHGYPRTTNDMDVWVDVSPDNAAKLTKVFQQFGFSDSSIDKNAFLDPKRIVRIGVPPVCIDVLMSVSGLEFSTCHERHETRTFDGVSIKLISREDLEINKKASGRLKDLNDLEYLP